MGATVLIAEIVLVQVRHGNLGEDLAYVCDTRVDPAQLPPSVMKRAVQDGAVATSAAVDRVFVGIGDVVVLHPLHAVAVQAVLEHTAETLRRHLVHLVVIVPPRGRSGPR